MFLPGTLLVYKTTGELCVVLHEEDDGEYQVRRPCMTHDYGIKHAIDTVAEFELETEEDHLRREAQSMVMKAKIQEEILATFQAQEEKKKREEEEKIKLAMRVN